MSTAGAAESGGTLRTDTMTPLHWVGVALATVTGLIHLWLAVSFLPAPLGAAFLVAALGFFVGVAAVVVGYRRRLAYALGLPFTLGQIALWYAVNGLRLAPVDLTDKAAQVALVAVLVVLYARSS